MAHRSPLAALDLVLSSMDAVRNGRALCVLLGTFAGTGLFLAMAQQSLGSPMATSLNAAAALFIAFYGGNAAGILLMDDAAGRPRREIAEALRHSLLVAHRLLLALAGVVVLYAAGAALVVGVFWLCRSSVTGPVVGPLLFALAVPLGVVAIGAALLALVAVVMPLSAPAIWAGAGPLDTLRMLSRVVRRRLVTVAMLMAAVSLLAAGIAAIVSFVVMTGGRAVSLLGVSVVGVDVPARELMAGLFGYGLRSLQGVGVPPGSANHVAASLVGGGVVFAVALVLPGLVYLRGTCSVYLAVHDDSL
jgi:hypothetical protein